MISDYKSIKEIAELWNISPRRVREMCAEGKIEGATKIGRDWLIPQDVKRPVDGRVKSGQYKAWRKKEDLV